MLDARKMRFGYGEDEGEMHTVVHILIDDDGSDAKRRLYERIVHIASQSFYQEPQKAPLTYQAIA